MDEESCIETAKKYINIADLDNDGKIDFEEFQRFILKLGKGLKSSVDSIKIKQIFNEIDTDNSEKLDEIEFGKALYQMLLETEKQWSF